MAGSWGFSNGVPSGSSGKPAWGLVVPVKRLSLAKSRLSSFGDERRQALALAFAADVVLAALEVAEEVIVVTDDAQAGRLLRTLGARVEPDDPDAGLNPALAHGVELLRSGHPGRAVATLSADLPALQAAELLAALAQVPSLGRGFVADLSGSGTTLLAAAAGAELAPEFGAASRAAHLASGAKELTAGAGLRQDVDTPEDLRAAAALGLGPHTERATQGLW